eukprot:1364719-Amorphochlora_amoeboformis.AAC.1
MNYLFGYVRVELRLGLWLGWKYLVCLSPRAIASATQGFFFILGAISADIICWFGWFHESKQLGLELALLRVRVTLEGGGHRGGRPDGVRDSLG